ncbi:MAG: AmmeMemoRadiSam system protein B [Bryobacteraceae bacterium]|nr:AmmeMemoRadiSam system protein B [Bryobacteraceae bacterium]
MSKPLPRLRMDLDFLPSPLEDRPGLMMRDPFGYSDVTLIVPPPLVPLLAMFDGEQSEDELRAAIYRMTNDLRSGEIMDHLKNALERAGFLEGPVFEQMKEARQRAFAESPIRQPAHAGSAYPDEGGMLREWMSQQGLEPGGDGEDLVGIAAPHVSPEGGWASYREAYRVLGRGLADRVFVVLGTSHYGEPEKFGLTRKDFVTPFGTARTERALVERLASRAPRASKMEDYCHAVEHSIEFQVVFLQALFGPEVRILPILVGPFARSLYRGGRPEEDECVREFLDALGELQAAEGKRLCWVLGVDMAHMGRRYGDPIQAEAQRGEMLEVAERDKARIQKLEQGDAEGFWNLVQPNHDDLKWCGSAPFYTFLKAVPEARGRMRHYEQWNIDPQSVVSFGAIEFRRAA